MTARTHIAASNALTLLILSPSSILTLLTTIISATIGGTICDLDVVTSDQHRYVDFFIFSIILIAISLGLLEYHYNLGIITYLKQNTNFLKIIICLGIMIIVCLYGMHEPHRSFMHSIAGLLIFTGLTYIILRKCVIPFFIGMSSHILLDLLNKKGVQLFYPFSPKICLKLCESDGLINNILFLLNTIIIIIRLFIIN